jgi:hypothetical protein
MAAIEITTFYQDNAAEANSESAPVFSERTPVFRNFAFSNFTITNAKQVASIHGLPEKAVEQLRFSDFTATGTTGFVSDHTNDVELHNVRVEAAAGSAFAFDQDQGIELEGVSSQSPQAGQPVVDLKDCSKVWLHASHAAQGTSIFLRHDGGDVGSIRLTDNDLTAAKVGVFPTIP